MNFEQQWTVARVAELLRWCDTLEAQLTKTESLMAQVLCRVWQDGAVRTALEDRVSTSTTIDLNEKIGIVSVWFPAWHLDLAALSTIPQTAHMPSRASKTKKVKAAKTISSVARRIVSQATNQENIQPARRAAIPRWRKP